MVEIAIVENRVADPGERGPAVTFHGEETAFDKAENERGVSMDVDGA